MLWTLPRASALLLIHWRTGAWKFCDKVYLRYLKLCTQINSKHLVVVPLHKQYFSCSVHTWTRIDDLELFNLIGSLQSTRRISCTCTYRCQWKHHNINQYENDTGCILIHKQLMVHRDIKVRRLQSSLWSATIGWHTVGHGRETGHAVGHAVRIALAILYYVWVQFFQ